MDPITALSVAAAAVQFFQFSLEALRLCKEIRDNSQHATAYNSKLESTTKDVRAAVRQLEHEDVRNRTIGSKRVSDLAKQCLQDSDELFNLLNKIRGAGKTPSTAKILFRSLKDGKTIEKLQNRLTDSQKRLDSAILHDVRTRIDLVAVMNSESFAELSTDVQALIKLFTQGEQTISKGFETMRLQSDSVRHDVLGINTTLQTMKLQESRNRLLNALAFPGMLSRREMIAPPYSKTFDWILQEPHPSVDSNLTFAGWLVSGTKPFWLSGKMGSGKSTLMLHIADDARTKRRLQIWAGPQPLHILSFFFWRPGPVLQHTIAGLLRSLLYQLIQRVPQLEDYLDDHNDATCGWTIARLGDLLRKAFQHCPQHRFCIFIDGLDEFEGDTDELLLMLYTLRVYTHVKLCVSSRPEAHLAMAFSDCLRMKLEDSNMSDITSFVFGKLSGYASTGQPIKQYSHRIAKDSQGVFLWAALTTQSVVRGLQHGDDEALLWQRIATIPKGMDALFSHIINATDEIHKPFIAFHIRAMQCIKLGILRQEDLVSLSAARYEHEISALEPFLTFCDRTGHQIEAQSQGLLELHRSPIYEVEAAWWIAADVSQPNTKRDWNREEVAAAHRISSTDGLCQRFALLERATVIWVHRSAYDFIFDGENELANAILRVYSLNDVVDALLRGQMKILVAAPYAMQEHGANFPTFQRRVTELVEMASRVQETIEDYSIDWVLRDLAHARDIILPRLPFPGIYPDSNYYDDPDVRMLTTMRNDSRVLDFRRGLLWCELLEEGLQGYVERHISEILTIDDHGRTLANLISSCCVGPKRGEVECTSAADLLLVLLDCLEQRTNSHRCANTGHDCASHLRSFLARFGDDYSWETVTYLDSHDDDVDVFLHRGVVSHLVNALAAWVSALGKESAAEENKVFDFSMIPDKCIRVLFKIISSLESLGVYTGSRPSKMKHIRPRRLFMQTTIGSDLHVLMQRGIVLPGAASALALARLKPTFRLVCYGPLGALDDDAAVATLDVSQELGQSLIPYVGCYPGCALEDLNIKSALLKEVWDNASGALDAWQQLFLLACIRTCARPLWAGIEGYTHEKDCDDYCLDRD